MVIGPPLEPIIVSRGHDGPMLILGYHRVNPTAKDGLSVTTDGFRSQLETLRDRGWKNVLLEAAPHSVKPPIEDKRFAITIDDGYQDNYLYAFPILHQLGMRATLFVATSYMDSNRPFPWVRAAAGEAGVSPEDLPLTWDQLDEMARYSFAIGSHTLTHPLLSRLDREAAYREIKGSKEVLEEKLGRPVPLFCYPAGDFNGETIELVKKAGYQAAVVSPDRYIPETPFTLRRVGVDRDTTPFLFMVKISPFFTALEKSRLGWRARRLLRSGYHKLSGASTWRMY